MKPIFKYNSDGKHLINWFYSGTQNDVSGYGRKATERSSADKLTRWIIIQLKGSTRKGIEKISRFA